MLTSPKCLSLEKSHHIVIYTEIVVNRMTNEFKGNRDMHMDDVNTFYFFLFGSTSEIVGDSHLHGWYKMIENRSNIEGCALC